MSQPDPIWHLRMAWRDSRGSRKLLLLYVLTIVFGIGAVVAIQSLRSNLLALVERESRSLLGADLVVQSRRPLSESAQVSLALLGGSQSREVRLRSMAYFPGPDQSHYVDVRTISGDYPYYGQMDVEPPTAWPLAATGSLALVEQALLQQMGLGPGDTLNLGSHTFTIAGSLLKVAGESDITGAFAARIYISSEDLLTTGLVQPGSMIRYRTYFQFTPSDTAWTGQVASLKTGLFAREGIRAETVADRQASIRDLLDNLLGFLNLIGLVALFLGGMGIAGAVRVYMGSKLGTIALLRCLGCSARSAFAIFLLQLAAAGFLGALAGVVAGVAIQFSLPALLEGFLPFAIEVSLDARTLQASLLFGWLVALLFSLWPLLAIRSITPLQGLRTAALEDRAVQRDRWQPVLLALSILVLTGWIVRQATHWQLGLGYAAGIWAILASLIALSAGLRWILKRFAGAHWPYTLRIALGNLHRPGNRTTLLMVTLGVGSLLLHLLLAVRLSLVERLDVRQVDDAPNLILLDVQPDQLNSATSLLTRLGYPPQAPLPIVTMRVHALRGKTLDEWRRTPDAGIEDWVYTWEFRNTQRGTLLENATLAAGTFTPSYRGEEPIPISVTQNLVEDMKIKLGDTIAWNVQGLLMHTVVGSIREVTWKAGRQNFNVVFPLGSLDDAPTVYALPIQVRDSTQILAVQTTLSRAFPNITLIDLSQVLETLDNILRRIGFVIQFMSLFTIATGLITLAASIAASRYQRRREQILFRILGADRRFLTYVPLIEYGLIGLLGSAAGWILAALLSSLLMPLVFSLPAQIPPVSSLG
ncbi:MAG: ABC transporter permease, partial [Kiritimatiellae bacterium]|nr:ABC transporter permease [Kiritimatiellia bacterium]